MVQFTGYLKSGKDVLYFLLKRLNFKPPMSMLYRNVWNVQIYVENENLDELKLAYHFN